MEVSYIIEQMEIFLKQYYPKGTDKNYFVIDFMDIAKFNPDIAEYFLNNPDNFEKIMQLSWKVYDSEIIPELGLKNIPNIQERTPNKILKNDLNKLLTLKGLISQKSELYAKAQNIKFECPNCGNIIVVIQEREYKEPTKCGCGRKGKFREIEQKMIDLFDFSIESLPESITQNETPRIIDCYIEGNLCEKEQLLYAGARFKFVGYLEKYMKYVNRIKSPYYYYKFKVIHFENLDEFEYDTKITPEEEQLFEAIKNHPHPHKFLREILFPHHIGDDYAIEAAICQQFCGRRTETGNRDTIHILFVGDAGTGKTDIAQRASYLNPINRFASGTELSAIGLIAAVERDKNTDRWVMKAGLLPRCNGGCVCIDELEKTNDSVKASLHTALESGFSVINKASISAKVVTETAIVATSNPISGNFCEKVSEKTVKLADTILDRMDLIFLFHDKINEKHDEAVSLYVLNRYTYDDENPTLVKKPTTLLKNQYTFSWNNNTYSYITIRKYIYNIKKKEKLYNIKQSKRLCTHIHRWYKEIRQASTYAGWEGKKVTPRLVESLIRFARALTRMKMKDTITIHELRDALEMFNFVYKWDKVPEEYINI